MINVLNINRTPTGLAQKTLHSDVVALHCSQMASTPPPLTHDITPTSSSPVDGLDRSQRVLQDVANNLAQSIFHGRKRQGVQSYSQVYSDLFLRQT